MHNRSAIKDATLRGPAQRPAMAFTLIELLMATAVLLLLLVVLMASGDAVTKSWGRLTEEQERFGELMTLDRTLDGILTNAIPFTWPDSQAATAKTVLAFKGEANQLSLAYKHRFNNAEDGAIRFVSLVLEKDALVAYYLERPGQDPAKGGGNTRNCILTRGVSRLRCNYADIKGADRKVTWVDTWEPERMELPLGIMVTVDWEDGRSESWLRRTAGNGYFERFGNWKASSGLSPDGLGTLPGKK